MKLKLGVFRSCTIISEANTYFSLKKANVEKKNISDLLLSFSKLPCEMQYSGQLERVKRYTKCVTQTYITCNSTVRNSALYFFFAQY